MVALRFLDFAAIIHSFIRRQPSRDRPPFVLSKVDIFRRFELEFKSITPRMWHRLPCGTSFTIPAEHFSGLHIVDAAIPAGLSPSSITSRPTVPEVPRSD
jgi:hypothetical protein